MNVSSDRKFDSQPSTGSPERLNRKRKYKRIVRLLSLVLVLTTIVFTWSNSLLMGALCMSVFAAMNAVLYEIEKRMK